MAAVQRPPAKSAERTFFLALTAFFLAFILISFSRTYFLHTLFGLPAPILFIQFHGIVMTGWIVLLLAQSALISVRRTKLHRQIGYAGAFYAAAMIPIGITATVLAATREVRAHSDFELSQLNVLGLELTQMLLFGAFFAAAVWLRNRADYHKRFIIVATLCLLPNAIVRLTLPITNGFFSTNLGILCLWTLMVGVIIAIDTVRHGRFHPVFARAAPIAIVAFYLAWMASRTPVWDQFWMRALA